ncbi:MAG: DUF72 domain-containing protein [Bauldia sp.]|nr:DUF72 domain-containing protein [Bauldia sp.]
MAPAPRTAPIRVGIGGWNYAPWRETFYPPEVKAKDELAYAASQLTSIEINGTFYRTQSPASFAKWRDETPDGFMFAVKGHRSVTNRAKLAEAGESVRWFLDSGLAELGPKLGPILWQLPHYKKFDAEDVGAFFAALPGDLGGTPLLHAIEVRHGTFVDPAFVTLARGAGVAVVYADSVKYPAIADVTGPFVYARLQNAAPREELGYPPADLDQWAERCRTWASGGAPADLPLLAAAPEKTPRPTFVYMINGAKERAPAAAMSLMARLGQPG